ncbi:MAG: DsbA family protein [bacterium]
MAKKSERSRRSTGQRPSAVAAAKRGGPGKGFWMALGAVAVLGVGALSYVATRPKTTSSKIDPTLPALKAEGYLMGNPAAPVEIIEFADFECPGCGQFATLTEPDIRTRMVNTGQVRVRFMDFPLPIHKNTWDASLAASCANEQGKFWEMHDLIFQNQDKWNGEATSRPRGPLGDLAKSLNLDMPKYNSCMDTEKFRANVQANLQEGERRQVSQTPSFIIGDQKIPGAIPFDVFRKLVDAELAKHPAAAAGDTTKLPPTDARKATVPTPGTKGK